MEWLCEATPVEIIRVGKRTNTVRELEAAVGKYVIGRIRRRNIYDPICSECGSKSIIVIDGADTCTNCGTCDMNSTTLVTTTTRTTILKRSLTIRGFVGLRDTCSSMLQQGIGIRYGSSSEASLDVYRDLDCKGGATLLDTSFTY
jgi:hypothetical protein